MSVAADLARRLAHQAEAVCRVYLSHGRREGAWWTAGDVFDTPGRSLYVRLCGERAGKWTEYVAADVMLPPDDWALSPGRSPVFPQHNVGAWRGIS